MTDVALAYETILETEDRGVVTLTINRSERMNALNWRLGLELRHAITKSDEREDVRAIIVTGAGKAFCAGQDLSSGGDAFQGGDVEDAQERERVTKALTVHGKHYWQMNTPIIAAINGAAVGAGLTIPMQFDIRLAAEDAKLGFVFNRRGVLPELNSPFIVPRVVGLSRGLELLLTGRIFTGREAADIGLVSAALPADQVLSAALEMAHDIATNVAPVSAGILKRLVYLGTEQTDPAAAQRLNHKLFGWTIGQADAVEGPTAFIEKRDPKWNLAKNADFPQDLLSG